MSKHEVANMGQHAPLRNYVIGFAGSVALTLGSFGLVIMHTLPSSSLVWIISSLAVVQLIVQLDFFLGITLEPSPRWRLIAFGAMAVVAIIVVFGSVWIMNNLNYHTMSPAELKTYLHANEGL
jgi:cytochrome o ubiquinol oxidase operon protein cyoD